jgi:uncharacterized PurR-regulated membrane protein YhhQ (DUF165 family)
MSTTTDKAILDRGASSQPLKCFNLVAILFVASYLMPWVPYLPRFFYVPIVSVIPYILNMILVEIYGYTRTCRVLWLGFGINALEIGVLLFLDWSLLAAYVARRLPPSLTNSASLLLWIGSAFLIEWLVVFVGSYVFAKLKVLTCNRHLWARIIGSVTAQQAVRTLLFIIVLVVAVSKPIESVFMSVVLSEAKKASALAAVYAIVATPLIYVMAYWLKNSGNQ